MKTANPLDLLLGPDWTRPGGDPRTSAALRVLGPGSVPLAGIVLVLATATGGGAVNFDEGRVLFPLIAAILVVTAGYLPELTVAAAFLVCWFAFVTGYTLFVVFATYFIALFAIARKYGWVVSGALFATLPALLTGLPISISSYGNSPGARLAAGAGVMIVLVVDAYVFLRAYRRQGTQLAEVQQDAAEERGQRLHLQERGRIAREMHDVVAHHMSMIAVKASTAEYRLAGLSDEAREEFQAIGDSARESLTEMRRLLAVFREQEGTAELTPQPGIEGIQELCRSATDAGVEVTATIDDGLPELPDAVSLTAYRIVQEAVSNIVRHAQGASASIELYPEGGWLALVVMNDAAPGVSATDANASDGLGLSGMRERVELLHGELFAEPLGRSGFVVKARLPLELVEEA